MSVVELGQRLGMRPASQLRPAAGGFIPLPSEWTKLWDGPGIRRGSIVEVTGSLGLVAVLMRSVTKARLWCAVVDVPALSAAAAARGGVDVSRCVFVAPGDVLADAVVPFVEGVDLIVVGAPSRLSAVAHRQMAARARTSGVVLVGVGPWPKADVQLQVVGSRWSGLSAGYGQLSSRRVRIRAEGRRVPVPRQVDVELSIDGRA